jgi:hypothetical protein
MLQDGKLKHKARIPGSVLSGCLVARGRGALLVAENAPGQVVYAQLALEDGLSVGEVQILEVPGKWHNLVTKGDDRILASWKDGAVWTYVLRDGCLDVEARVPAPQAGCTAVAALPGGFVLSVDAAMNVNLRESRLGISVMKEYMKVQIDSTSVSCLPVGLKAALICAGGYAYLLQLPASGVKSLFKARSCKAPLEDAAAVQKLEAWWKAQDSDKDARKKLEATIMSAARARTLAAEAIAALRFWSFGRRLLRDGLLVEHQAVRLVNARPALTWALASGPYAGPQLLAAMRQELTQGRVQEVIEHLIHAMDLHRQYSLEQLEKIPELPPLERVLACLAPIIDAKCADLSLMTNGAEVVHKLVAGTNALMLPVAAVPKLLTVVQGLATPPPRPAQRPVTRFTLTI